jgi:hypothetical protein
MTVDWSVVRPKNWLGDWSVRSSKDGSEDWSTALLGQSTSGKGRPMFDGNVLTERGSVVGGFKDGVAKSKGLLMKTSGWVKGTVSA